MWLPDRRIVHNDVLCKANDAGRLEPPRGCAILGRKVCGAALHSPSVTQTLTQGRGPRHHRVLQLSGPRIFSALEVAGDVFSRADVGQQLVEPRRRAL